MTYRESLRDIEARLRAHQNKFMTLPVGARVIPDILSPATGGARRAFGDLFDRLLQVLPFVFRAPPFRRRRMHDGSPRRSR